MNRNDGWRVAAVILAVACWGCEMGVGAVEPGDEPAVETPLVESVPSAPPTSNGEVDSTVTAPYETDPSTAAAGDPSAAATGLSTSADCIDFSTGIPRLVNCTLRRMPANPIGHDDPDPWHPNPTAVPPY